MSRLVDAAYALAKTGSFAKEGRSTRPMQAKAYNALVQAALETAKKSDAEWAGEVGFLRELVRKCDKALSEGGVRHCGPDLDAAIEIALED